MSDFDWSDTSNQPVREQMATALYYNPHGDVVVRQRDVFGDDQVYIVLTPDNARRLALAMLRLVEAEPDTSADTTAPNDPTAQRQRRHRDKHRDSHAETVASERDTETPPLLKVVS